MKQWVLKSVDEDQAKKLSAEVGIHPITARVLINRGITTADTAEKFLKPRLAHLPDPKILPNISAAVDRTLLAIERKEKITIYGDYDADGITSTALLTKFFHDIGVDVDNYIPSRLDEGYGLNSQGIDELAERGTKLIITVDCGTNSLTEIAYAKEKGLDLIVTDHHEPAEKYAQAVNPKLDESAKELNSLAGVGVAFYFASALKVALKKDIDLKKYLDLVAIGTVADIVPLNGINRTLTSFGIAKLRSTENIGIKALCASAATDISRIDAYGIAFRIAPRINAGGRMGDQYLALKLLLTDNNAEAEEIALSLNKFNVKRQSIEEKIVKEAVARIEAAEKRPAVVLASDEWHPGVIGIVASKIAELHRSPCAMISLKDGTGRGSVRGVGNFSVIGAMEYSSKYLNRFGGHRAAAGFEIEEKNIANFADKFNEYTSKNLKDEDRLPKLSLDANLEMKDICERLITELEAIGPYGEGNPKPIFSTEAAQITDNRCVGKNHLKLNITKNSSKVSGIAFGFGDFEIDNKKEYRFAGMPEFNEWNGKRLIQFNVRDIKDQS